MNIPSRPSAVVFDIDGTLLDSNDGHAHAWVDALHEHNYSVALDRTRALIGKGGDKLLPELTGIDVESDLGRAIAVRRQAIFKERYLPQIEAQDGARELVQRVLANDQRALVATSAQGDELSSLLERAGINDLITLAASSADAERSKPDPDIICAALQKAGIEPSAAIMVGDTPYDRDAAHRAGVPFVGLRCGGWDDEALSGAQAIYDDPAALLLVFDFSPLAMTTGRAQS
jgi:HAD superfamily hydrolase (TIGR01549 family)